MKSPMINNFIRERETFFIYVWGDLRDHDTVPGTINVPNSATAKATLDTGSTQEEILGNANANYRGQSHQMNYRIREIPAPGLQLIKRGDGRENFQPGETYQQELIIRSDNYWLTYSEEFQPTLDDTTVVDLLPVGFEYVPGSASVGEPSVLNDYLNSGRTALIWNIGTMNIAADYHVEH